MRMSNETKGWLKDNLIAIVCAVLLGLLGYLGNEIRVDISELKVQTSNDRVRLGIAEFRINQNAEFVRDVLVELKAIRNELEKRP